MPARIMLLKPRQWAKCSATCLLLALGFLVACTPEPDLAPLPTMTLISIPTSPTPPPTPTPATTTPLPQPEDLRPQPTSNTMTDAISFILTPSVSTQPDPQIIRQSRDALASQMNLDSQRVRPATLTRDDLYRADFACANPNNLPEVMHNYDRYHDQERYRLTFLIGITLYTYHLTANTIVALCPDEQTIADELLLAVDPVAYELMLLAQRRIAQEVDLPQRRVQWVSIQAHTWADTSLGCPEPGQTYQPATIEGYRLVLQAGERFYTFHTDSASLFPCLNQSAP